MKKNLLAILCASVLGFSGSAFAQSVERINTEIVKLLQPYQDSQTKAELKINSLSVSGDHVQQADGVLKFEKAGKLNTFALNLSRVHYDYAQGVAPKTDFEGALSLDLTKVFSSADLNGIIDDFENTLKMLVGEAFKEYGEAIVVSAQVSDKVKDASGNYVSVKAILNLKIDASKLPAGKKMEDIPMSSAQARVSLEVKNGLSMNGSVLSNPSYKGFAKGNLGLKEFFDNILSRDRSTLQQLNHLIKQINDLANSFVNG